MGYRRIERPTPEQWQVVAWMFIVALAGLGSVGLWFALQAPPAKADIARHLLWIGIASWSLATIVWGMKRGIELYLA